MSFTGEGWAARNGVWQPRGSDFEKNKLLIQTLAFNAEAWVGLLLNWGRFLDSDKVPKAVVDATCELARELLIADRTAAPLGEGLKYENVGTTQTGYDKDDTRPVISRVAQAMLAKFGAVIKSRSGAVRLVRS